MLDIVRARNSSTNPSANALADALKPLLERDATLYFGFPVLPTNDQPLIADGLLISWELGIVLFTFPDQIPANSAQASWEELRQQQRTLLAGVRSKLQKEPRLCDDDGELQVRPQVFLFTALPTHGQPPVPGIKVSSPDSLADVIASRRPLSEEQHRLVSSVFENVSTLRPRKRRLGVQRQSSRGGKLREIEREINNLDRHQKHGALETPDGPQRLRGLAGSGKTVILALKAAFLHTTNPEWKIAVTYHTRSLRQQYEELIRRFCYELLGDEPDFSSIQIRPAWGSASEPGIYSQAAIAAGMPIYTFETAKNNWTRERAFEGACDELLKTRPKERSLEVYDAILIDEAQDLPRPFFELAFLVSKGPHRIVWAYDELQNLTSYTMQGPEVLFGVDSASDKPNLFFTSGNERQDIVLPKCYRNSPWTLSAAHALGFGIYRSEGLVQYFDDHELWNDIGYEVVSGEPSPGEHVVLQRSAEATPNFFARLLEPNDALSWQKFASKPEQYDWIVEQIFKNINGDELEPDDILVVFPDPISFKSESAILTQLLAAKGLQALQAGVSASRDVFRVENHVTLSGIHRAKGNEAPMVYVANADQCADGHNLVNKRNTLFTAITRSRAWARVTGVGSRMDILTNELQSLKEHKYRLSFKVPTAEELESMRTIHRDRAESIRENTDSAVEYLQAIVEQIESGQVEPTGIPINLIDKLSRHRRRPK
ncbi:MAG: ATP-binding domain-containing protein [Archangiaceae bacterium]|nr:ATP-binding domain-containing protein [Archangiaceae bacterium]